MKLKCLDPTGVSPINICRSDGDEWSVFHMKDNLGVRDIGRLSPRSQKAARNRRRAVRGSWLKAVLRQVRSTELWMKLGLVMD